MPPNNRLSDLAISRDTSSSLHCTVDSRDREKCLRSREIHACELEHAYWSLVTNWQPPQTAAHAGPPLLVHAPAADIGGAPQCAAHAAQGGQALDGALPAVHIVVGREGVEAEVKDEPARRHSTRGEVKVTRCRPHGGPLAASNKTAAAAPAHQSSPHGSREWGRTQTAGLQPTHAAPIP